MFTELSLGCWSLGHKNLSMYQVSSSTVFFFVSYMHNTCPLYNVLLEVVCCCFPRNNILLNMPMFVGSQSFISLPSFMFVSAVVSEIRELKKEKKNSEIDNFQLNTFPGHIIIIYPLIFFPLHHKLKVIIKISLSTL